MLRFKPLPDPRTSAPNNHAVGCWDDLDEVEGDAAPLTANDLTLDQATEIVAWASGQLAGGSWRLESDLLLEIVRRARQAAVVGSLVAA